MSVETNEQIRGAIAEAGAAAYPQEACGLVIAAGKKQRVIVCRNVSSNPRETFAVSRLDYAAAVAEGDIIAAWHTHPDGDSAPTEGDVVGCEASELPYLILGLRPEGDAFVFSELRLLEPSGAELPYTGRPYVSGLIDCYSIVRDWYRREYGIALGDYPRQDDDGRPGYSYFLERYAQEGFVRLIDSAPRVGDVFVMQVNGPVPNHLAVYVGDDRILHHAHDRLSSHAIYGGGYWQKHTVAHLRHQGVVC